CGVSGRSIDAPHLDAVAGAVQLLEQPFGPQLSVLHLVVGEDVRFRGGDRLVNGHHDDTLGRRFLDHRVERVAVRRVEDDGVDARGDQVAEIGDLFRRTAVAVGDRYLCDDPRYL